MAFLDFRTWTERRIAFVAAGVSILCALFTMVSIAMGWSSNYLSLMNAETVKYESCKGEILNKFDSVLVKKMEISNLGIMCIQKPSEYCGEFRVHTRGLFRDIRVLKATYENHQFRETLSNIEKRISEAREFVIGTGKMKEEEHLAKFSTDFVPYFSDEHSISVDGVIGVLCKKPHESEFKSRLAEAISL